MLNVALPNQFSVSELMIMMCAVCPRSSIYSYEARIFHGFALFDFYYIEEKK